jgi:hypothetical protein
VMSLDDPCRSWQAISSQASMLARVSGTQECAGSHVSCRVSGQSVGIKREQGASGATLRWALL